MDLMRIAIRIAAGPALQLQGPFAESKYGADHETEINFPFGIVGAFAPILAKMLGIEESEVQTGPIESVPVGYEVVQEYYQKGSRATFHHPGDPEEYELIVKITHIGEYKLSDADSNLINKKTHLPEQIAEKMSDYHLEQYLEGLEPDYEPPDY